MCVSLLPACMSVTCACTMVHTSKNVLYVKAQVSDRHYLKTIWDRRVMINITAETWHCRNYSFKSIYINK